MEIIWDEEKNNKLFFDRGIRFEDIAEIIINNKYIDIIENPTRDNQLYFVINLNNYIHIVPFVVDTNNTIVLKTIFPSKKYNNLYRGKK